MKKHGEIALKPKLRFPDFRDAGDWERKKLSALLFETKQRNRQLKYGPSEVLSVSGEYGCVNQIELLGRSYAGVSVKDYHIVETGDIVYTKSPLKKNPYGIIKANKGKPGIVSTLYAVYRATDIGHPDFLDHYFSRDYNLNRYLQPIVRKGPKNDMKVNNADVLTGEICVPKLVEQQRITKFLSSLNELIAAQALMLNALKTHKKGLLQQLFPREGETLPILRFPEFRNAPRWKVSQLRNHIDEFHETSTIQDEFEVLTSSRAGLLRQREYYDNTRITERDNIGFNIIPPNYVTYRSRSDDRRFFLNENKLGITGIVSIYYPVFRILNGCNSFFCELFTHYAEPIGRNSIGTSQTVLSLNELKKLKLPLPGVEEQQKIAACLSTRDELIAVQTQKLVALISHKKGLMQQLFPSPEQVEA